MNYIKKYALNEKVEHVQQGKQGFCRQEAAIHRVGEPTTKVRMKMGVSAGMVAGGDKSEQQNCLPWRCINRAPASNPDSLHFPPLPPRSLLHLLPLASQDGRHVTLLPRSLRTCARRLAL